MIKITIQRLKENPEYGEWLKIKKEASYYEMNRIDNNRPPEVIPEDILATEITEEQFQAIRKVVLEKF